MLTNKQKYIRKTLQKTFREKFDVPKYLFEDLFVEAPINFDLLNNSNECIYFFNSIIKFIRNHRNDSKPYRINILLSNINNITVETVMYLIALSSNSSKWKNIRFNVLLPKNINLSNLILSTGIHNFMNCSEIEIPKNDKYFYVKHGSILDRDIARNVCDFVNGILGTERTYSRFLYDMLVEMMMNTSDHAYNNLSNIFDKKWYICIENSENTINFYFLDTGTGIPETMLNYLVTIGNSLFSDNSITFIKTDSNLILTALKGGELVSRTQLKHRGKGLPEIYTHYKKGKTSNFKIMSGKGHCSFNDKDRTKGCLIDLYQKFEGTLIYWEIDKNTILV